MDILFISHKYPPSTGGMEKQSFELITGMKSKTPTHSIIYDGNESRFKFFFLLNKRILEKIKANPNISILHFNDGLIAAFSLFHRKYNHLKRTLTLHGLDVVFPVGIYQRFIFPRFNAFDLIIAVSKATADACQRRGIDKEKIVVVNNGVDLAPVHRLERTDLDRLLFQKYHTESKDKRILVSIGRPVKRKGFSWFIKHVMPQLNSDFILLMIGPISHSKKSTQHKFLPKTLRTKMELFFGFPSDEYAVNRFISEINNGKVKRLGKLPLDEVQAILCSADAFIMPNIEVSGDMEGFGLVCLEACMCGAKVIASASGGITDAIIHGKNGILLPPGDADSWIKTLNQLIEAPDSIRLNAQETISFTRHQYSWQKMCNEYLLHFSTL